MQNLLLFCKILNSDEFNSLHYLDPSLRTKYSFILLTCIALVEVIPSNLTLQTYFMKTIIYDDKFHIKSILSVSCNIYIFLLYDVFMLLFIYMDFFTLLLFHVSLHLWQFHLKSYFSMPKAPYLSAVLVFACCI